MNPGGKRMQAAGRRLLPPMMGIASRKEDLPSQVYVFPLPENTVFFPGTSLTMEELTPADMVDPKGTAAELLLKAFDEVTKIKKDYEFKRPMWIACLPQKGAVNDEDDGDKPENSQDKLFDYGVLARVISVKKITTGPIVEEGGTAFSVSVRLSHRIKVYSYTSPPEAVLHSAKIEHLIPTTLPEANTEEHQTLVDDVIKLKREAETFLIHLEDHKVGVAPGLASRLEIVLRGVYLTTSVDGSDKSQPNIRLMLIFIDSLFGYLPSDRVPISHEDKLDILRFTDATQRVSKAVDVITRANIEFESMVLPEKDEKKESNSTATERRQREFVLLQRLDSIRKELRDISQDPESPLHGKVGASFGFLGNNASKDPRAIRQAPQESDENKEMDDLKTRLEEKEWSAEAEAAAWKEFSRLAKTPPQGSEHGVIRNYLEHLLSVPWVPQPDKLRMADEFMKQARDILERDHYGLNKIKKRLLEWLAIMKLKQDSDDHLFSLQPKTETLTNETESGQAKKITIRKDERGRTPIILLTGPPGTGKTSIAKSLAKALGRNFYRIALGGVRDEAEIRGHRRTYVAAMPGRIVEGVKKAGAEGVILLDEIDKLAMSNNHGDPAAALLEVLDPEQNNTFVDHYLGVPLDLSHVLFIATANSLSTISEPLLDRMEVIELPGYVHEEKLQIAKQYLIPKQLKLNLLPEQMFSMKDEVLLDLITGFTFESGVRQTERHITTVIRSKAVDYAQHQEKCQSWENEDIIAAGYKKEVQKDELVNMLGMERYGEDDLTLDNRDIGVAMGLTYAGAGNGDVLYIETTTMPGSGSFQMTGRLGETLSESAELCFVWIKAHAYQLGIAANKTTDAFDGINVHLHLPSGSVKKDGPSAGVGIVTAMVSLLRGIPVKKGVAMTGEITLRGKVTAVGGIREKVLAAHRANLKTIIMPSRNRVSVDLEVPENVRRDIRFVYVSDIWEALAEAFGEAFWEGVENAEDRKNQRRTLEARL